MITAAAPANIAFWVEGAPAAPFNNSDAAGRCKIERSVVVTTGCTQTCYVGGGRGRDDQVPGRDAVRTGKKPKRGVHAW